jgi:hypothetical protein
LRIYERKSEFADKLLGDVNQVVGVGRKEKGSNLALMYIRDRSETGTPEADHD